MAADPTLSEIIYGDFAVHEEFIDIDFDQEDMETDEEYLNAVKAMESAAFVEQESINPETVGPPQQETPLQQSADRSKPKPKPRFAVVDDDEVDELMSGINSKGTTKMTKWGVNQFKCMNKCDPLRHPCTRTQTYPNNINRSTSLLH